MYIVFLTSTVFLVDEARFVQRSCLFGVYLCICVSVCLRVVIEVAVV